MMRVVKYKTRLNGEGRAVLEKDISVNYPEMDRTMNRPEQIVRFAREFLRMHEDTEEYMYMLCLNTKLVMTGVFEISHGNVNSSIVGPREVFQKALLANAVSIVMLHNHPSGNPTPSREDIMVTNRLVECGKLLGVDVLDHLIIAGGTYCSLRERGDM
jgi:DNA repair protein RadC